MPGRLTRKRARLLAAIEDADTRACVDAERAFCARWAGAVSAVSAHGRIINGQLHLVGARFEAETRRGEVTGKPQEASALGTALAQQLLK